MLGCSAQALAGKLRSSTEGSSGVVDLSQPSRRACKLCGESVSGRRRQVRTRNRRCSNKKMAGKLGAEISGRRTGRDEMVCGWPATGDGRGCARVSSRRTADGTRVRPKRGLSPISRWTGGLGHREGWPFICALRGAPGVKGKATPTDQVLCTVRARDTQSGKRACASVRLAAVVSGSSDH